MDDSLRIVLVIAAVLGFAAWFAVVSGTAIYLRAVRETGDVDATVRRAARLARLGTFVGIPAALVVAGSGTWYVLGRELSIDPNWWIGTAIAAWLVAFAGSTITRGSQLGTAVRLSQQHGAGDEDVQWRIRRVDLTARGEALLLAVAAMVVALQPTGTL